MIPSTQLWLGHHDLLVQKVYAYLMELYGARHQDAIRERQFYAVRWYAPEKNLYTRADLEPLFHHLSFASAATEKNFVILTRADTLSVVCANSLLKLLEEPPAGYYFILLAQSRDAVLPTIQSRSVITECSSYGLDQGYSAFLALFKNPVAGAHLRMMQDLEKAAISEYQSRLALDQLTLHWSEQYQKALADGNSTDAKYADRMMRIIAHMSDHPPMHGSVKLFWRTLYVLMTL